MSMGVRIFDLYLLLHKYNLFQHDLDVRLHTTKTPGPDGLPTLFYHKFWHVVGEEVTNEVLQVLNEGKPAKDLNHTFICLIPKVKKLRYAKEFRLISLCNVIG